ncbi:MAG: hypothetical protein WDZ85_02480 [Candidatus Paceibacterota bacterium]
MHIGKKIENIQLAVTFLREGKSVIAYAPALDISTVGKTEKEAQKNFEEAVQLFLDDIVERDVVAPVLVNLGWVKKQTKWQPPKESIKSIKVALVGA